MSYTLQCIRHKTKNDVKSMKKINWDALINKKGWTVLGAVLITLIWFIMIINPVDSIICLIAMCILSMFFGIGLHIVTTD